MNLKSQVHSEPQEYLNLFCSLNLNLNSFCVIFKMTVVYGVPFYYLFPIYGYP